MNELSLTDYLTILRQRKLAFLLAFSAIFVVAILLALSWSNYRSTATIGIEQPQVSSDMTTPMGMNPNDMPEALADLRISKIQQKVTAPSTLVDIINTFNLYPDARAHEPLMSVAERMGDKIKLTLISSIVANPAAAQKVSVDQLSAIAFTLSFDYSDPQTAQKIANELVARFLDEDLKDRRNQAEATSDFIQGQIATLDTTMVDQEKKIADFEAVHGATRPETLMFNQQASANVALSLQNLDGQIATNEGTEGSLRSQLTTIDPYSRVIADGQVLTTPAIQLKALKSQYTTLIAQYGPNHPDVVKVKHQIEALRAETGGSNEVDASALKAQIDDVKTNLMAAQKNYGPDNPDVVSLNRQLENLEGQLAVARHADSLTNGIHQDADNPAYIGLVAQLKSVEEQHKSLLYQRDKLVADQEKYQQAVLANPALQQQMAALSRDYDNAQLRYRELKEKKMAADMDKQMIEDHRGQRLVVISPPQLPLKTHPRQLFIVLAGFMLAIMVGFATVAIRQTMSQSILGRQHLESLVGAPPLISVPYLYTKNERGQNHAMKSRSFLHNLIVRFVPPFKTSG